MAKIAIVGMGAIGTYLASKLFENGNDIHCLHRSDFYHVKNNGINVTENNVTKKLNPNVYIDACQMPKCDIVFVTLKTTENSILPNILPILMNKNSSVVILQNGIGSEEELSKYIKSASIIGATTTLKVLKTGPGSVKHIGFKLIEIAQYFDDDKKTGNSENCVKISKILNSSGLICNILDHLPTMRWKKLVSNIPAGALQIILNSKMKDLVKNKNSFDLLCDLSKEVIQASIKCNSYLSESYLKNRIDVFHEIENLPPYFNSIKEDFDLKKPLEIESIYANAIKIAEKNKASMPLTKAVYNQILFLVCKSYNL